MEKPKLYARMGVPEFFRYDPEGKLTPALAGFELPRRGRRMYRPLPTERFGEDVVGIRSNVLGVCLCVRRAEPEPMVGSVVCYDPAASKFLPTLYDLDAKVEASEAEVAALKAQIERMRRERG